jgi:hypothetical protein
MIYVLAVIGYELNKWIFIPGIFCKLLFIKADYYIHHRYYGFLKDAEADGVLSCPSALNVTPS